MKGVRIGSEEEATFQTQLTEAHIVENRLAEYFKTNYNCTVKTSQELGSFPAWDLSIDFIDEDVNITFECKQDKLVWKTKNVAVEWQRTLKDGTVKPTCISISQAEIYAYYFNSCYWLIPTDKLRQLISDNNFTIKHNAGDGSRASVYLIPVDVFKKSCPDKIKVE